MMTLNTLKQKLIYFIEKMKKYQKIYFDLFGILNIFG